MDRRTNKKYKLPKQKIEVEKKTYQLSNIGLHYFERGSKFDTIGKFNGIRFKNIRNSIIIIGNGNIVQRNHYKLYDALDILKNKVMLTDLSENTKLDYMAEIETIKAQLAKSRPEKSIIKKAWEKIRTLSQIADLAELIAKIYSLIKIFL